MAILLLNIKRLLKTTQIEEHYTHMCVARQIMETDQLEIVNFEIIICDATIIIWTTHLWIINSSSSPTSSISHSIFVDWVIHIGIIRLNKCTRFLPPALNNCENSVKQNSFEGRHQQVERVIFWLTHQKQQCPSTGMRATFEEEDKDLDVL